MKRDKFEFLIAYKLAVKNNALKADFLVKLHQRERSTIEKYMYETGRNPSFVMIFELFMYLKIAKAKIPLELSRIYQRHYQRAYAGAQNKLK